MVRTPVMHFRGFRFRLFVNGEQKAVTRIAPGLRPNTLRLYRGIPIVTDDCSLAELVPTQQGLLEIFLYEDSEYDNNRCIKFIKFEYEFTSTTMLAGIELDAMHDDIALEGVELQVKLLSRERVS